MKTLRRSFLAGLLSIASAPALARRFFKGGPGSGAPTVPTITDINLSGTTFVGGSPDATRIGDITVILNTGSFTGTLSENSASFVIVGIQLETEGVVAAGSYPITITATQSGATNSPFSKDFTIVGSGSGTEVTTLTFANTSGSASGADTPVETYVVFAKGAVPSGQYAEPRVGGVALTGWQADNRILWNDNSLRGAVYRFVLPAGITGNGSQQVSFVTQTGAWPNSSAVTPATITGESDFNIAISKLHTAMPFPSNEFFDSNETLIVAGLTINSGTGQVSGGLVQYNKNAVNVSGKAVGEGRGSGAVISINNLSVVVDNGGSGYAYEDTNGNFRASFNQCVTNSGGSPSASNRWLRQYAKGGACDGFTGMMQVVDSTSGTPLPHMMAIFYVERWKKPDGTLLGYKSCVFLSTGLAESTNNLYNYTYDLDWRNGSTVIRGTALSSQGFTTIPHTMFGTVSTLDLNGQMDWTSAAGGLLASDAAYKAIMQYRTAAEADYFKATGILPPYLKSFNGVNDIGSSFTVPSLQSAFVSDGNAINELSAIPYVQPMGQTGIRCPQGQGGGGHNEAVVSDTLAFWYVTLKNQNRANAKTWLTCARGAAANNGSGIVNVGPHVELTTGFVPCAVPTSAQSFSGMNTVNDRTAATWYSLFGSGARWKGYVSPLFNGTGVKNNVAASTIMGPFHLGLYQAFPYVVEGAQWMLDQMLWTAGTLGLYLNQFNAGKFVRQVTFNGVTYHALCLTENSTTAQRASAWHMRTLGVATLLRPATWADGSTDIERSYLAYTYERNLDFAMALIPFVGTVNYGGAMVSKRFDWTASGQWMTGLLEQNTIGPDAYHWFYEGYFLDVMSWLSWIGPQYTKAADLRDHLAKAMIGRVSTAGSSHYLFDAVNATMVLGPDGAPVTNWAVNAASPTWGVTVMRQGASAAANVSNCALKFTSGSANIAVRRATALTTTSTDAVMMYDWTGPTTFADGSAILLTPADNNTPSGIGLSNAFCNFTGSISGTTLTVSAITTGTLFAGMSVFGNGVASATNPVLAGTKIVSQLTGSPGSTGTYEVSQNHTSAVASSSMRAGGVPAPFDQFTWYWMRTVSIVGSAQTITLHPTQADALANTNAITPTVSMDSVAFYGVPANTPIADNSGKGTYNNSNSNGGWTRTGQMWGDAALYRAFGGTFAGKDAAVTNTQTIANAIGVNFADQPIYAYDSAPL